MATGKKPSRKGERVLHPHASYFEVKNGGRQGAYKAGELFGCPGHRTYTHQPCCDELTDGAIKCKHCQIGSPVVWRGYLPLWDCDWCLRYVLVNEDHEASVDAIPWKANVMCSRAKNPISPIVVREELCFTRELPNREPWSKPIDMRLVCLTLWKDAAMTSWFMSIIRADMKSDNVLSLTKDGKQTGDPMYRAAHERWGNPQPKEPQLAGESTEEYLRRVMRSQEGTNGKNGKHTKK